MTALMRLHRKLTAEMDAGILDGFHCHHTGYELPPGEYLRALTTVSTREAKPRRWLFNYQGTIEYPYHLKDIL